MKLDIQHILLADDDTDDCIFFKEAVDEMELSTNITVVHDGEQLMKLLIHELNDLPHVLFLDLNMPRKNGFECLAEIRQSQKLNQLPVIVFSTSFEQEVVNRLYQIGANYFIRKPAEFTQFKKIIQHTCMIISKDYILQPGKENFVITV